MSRIMSMVAVAAAVCAGGSLQADTLVYDGRPDLFNSPEDVLIPQFDDFGGTSTLQSVTIESYASMRGGYVDPHTSEGCVDWHMNIQVEYYLDYATTPRLLHEAGCMVNGQANCEAGGGEVAVDVFCSSGWQTTTITDPAQLAEWIGTGFIFITADSDVDFGSTNDDLIGFGAGASAQYIVTYTYFDGPPPCVCEMDGDAGQVDVFDLLAYLDLWFLADARAEIDDTPGVDVFDLLGYLDCWFAGC